LEQCFGPASASSTAGPEGPRVPQPTGTAIDATATTRVHTMARPSADPFADFQRSGRLVIDDNIGTYPRCTTLDERCVALDPSSARGQEDGDLVRTGVLGRPHSRSIPAW
jgi:hypothetical protein